jgi:hypothetical protein
MGRVIGAPRLAQNSFEKKMEEFAESIFQIFKIITRKNIGALGLLQTFTVSG